MTELGVSLEPAPVIGVTVEAPAPIVLVTGQPATLDVELVAQPEIALQVVPQPELAVVLESAQGPAGPPGMGAVGIPFAFGDATPVNLGDFYVGVVVAVSIVILEPFDGANPAIEISTPLVLLMAAEQNLPGEAGRYETSPGLRLSVPTPLELHITPGVGATTGSGIVYLEIVS